MQKANKWLCLTAVVSSLVAVVMTAETVSLWRKLVEVGKDAEPSQTGKAEARPNDLGKPTTTNAVNNAAKKPEARPSRLSTKFHEMKVRRFFYDGSDDEIMVTLSEKPDMSVVKRYVSVEPLVKGNLAFSLTTRRRWLDGASVVEPALSIRGDFAHRTNVTLRIQKGFPMDTSVFKPAPNVALVADPLAEDYVHSFVRRDRSPKVGFADNGRYLPPLGKRQVALVSVNVSNIVATAFRVPSANIVQMLALEEEEYSVICKGWGDDDEFVRDISAKKWTANLPMPNKLNEEERTTFGLGTTNGVYLVKVGAECAGERYRVVCVTDLGISARRSEGGILVWVTSLANGVPVTGATVEVYTKANVLVGKGVSGADGLAFVECPASSGDARPFAVVVSSADGGDCSFVSLASSMIVNEDYQSDANGKGFLGKDDLTAFAWTERGIYRHDERMLFHALVRRGDCTAPNPIPLELTVLNPSDDVYLKKTLMSDDLGAVDCEDVSIPADQPSGTWTLVLSTPGKDGKLIGRRHLKVEEFAPPQIRVKTVAATGVAPKDFAFVVSAEHLYGGPAKDLFCEGAVVFEDVPFAPAGWKGWRFGDSSRSLLPNFSTLAPDCLDAKGECRVSAPLCADNGRPSAAVRATAQGTVFEDGGRPATSRDSAILHYYPYYIGTTLSSWQRMPEAGRAKISVACVAPDGKRLGVSKSLKARLERIDNVYSYKVDEENGWTTWKCDRIKTTVAEGLAVETPADGDAEFEIPTDDCGDYALTIADADGEVSFGMEFYLSSWGDDSIRAPLSNPTAVALTPDKPFYRPGEIPRIRVRSPFAGAALLTVMRDGIVYAEALTLTNATCEVELRAVEADWAPNVNVSLNVLQGVASNAHHLSVKAHGEATVCVRRPENEVDVSVAASFKDHEVSAKVRAPGAKTAVVTLVDEGINILTGEATPDPIGWFARPRLDDLALYDLYRRILPVLGEDELRANGAKTGGGVGAEMLDRVSPVATRRFKPLALWSKRVPVVDGTADVTFTLPEFAGEVRVTAVAYSDIASGAASVQCKATPKLVAQPDAPRFAAPGDEFEVTLPLANKSGGEGDAEYEISCIGATVSKGSVHLKDGESSVLRFTVKASEEPGQMPIRYVSKGFGEVHETEIEVPVRPACAWREKAGFEALEPGKEFAIPKGAEGRPSKFRHHVSATPLAELKGALEWLADYPYGCLEQTASRIFPLVSAGGILNALNSSDAVNRKEYVEAGVRRVESMVRRHDFVMWPDCNYAPWDREVSLYAAHFLVEAERSGVKMDPLVRDNVFRFLGSWAMSPTNSVSAYACHTLALAGRPEKDRMYRLYDARADLDLLTRARLARAFAAVGDRARADELLKNAGAPDSVREAAFTLLALLELGPDDARCAGLVAYLSSKRDKARFSWGTTGENAHALLALGEYWRHHPVKPGKPDVKEMDGKLVNSGEGTAFVSWKLLDLPKLGELPDEAEGLRIRRDFIASDGDPYDVSNAKCGDLVMVRISLSSKDTRDLNDLVIEDLFAGAMEPVHGAMDPSLYPWIPQNCHSWVMRSDARDDRILVFSKKFHLNKGDEVRFYYPMRVVSAGAFQLPKVAVEAMYQPGLRARSGGGRVVARH